MIVLSPDELRLADCVGPSCVDFGRVGFKTSWLILSGGDQVISAMWDCLA